MDTLSEIATHLSGSARAIVIARKDLDLRPGSPDNRVFILKIGEGSQAAGGRGGGFGERKVTAVFCYELKDGKWARLLDAGEVDSAGYEVPYHVSRLPLTLADGSESMGYGVVEPELVEEMSKKSGLSSSA